MHICTYRSQPDAQTGGGGTAATPHRVAICVYWAAGLPTRSTSASSRTHESGCSSSSVRSHSAMRRRAYSTRPVCVSGWLR
jgi:hypothetical protein